MLRPTTFILFLFLALNAWAQHPMGPIMTGQTLPVGAAEYVWYEPAGLGEAVQYEKVELGIALPIKDRGAIVNYLRELKIGPGLNPYDPVDIDVQAKFSYLTDTGWEQLPRVYGFFYRDFSRNIAHPDPNRHKWSNIPNPHDFRVRFAPPSAGDYRCEIVVYIKGELKYSSGEFAFKAEAGSDSGYIKVAANKRYFECGDELYFPIGVNMTTPRCKDDRWENVYCEGVDNSSPFAKDGWSNGKTMHPLAYEAYIRELQAAAEGGANYFRMVTYPWALDIEFEKLTNYDSRMNIAWEMDSIVSTAEQLGLKFNLTVSHRQLALIGSYNYFSWDWSERQDPCSDKVGKASCYNIPEKGLVMPADFLTSEYAMNAYKKKIRYQFARWGYSTSWSIYTIGSEMNGFGGHSAASQYKKCNTDHLPTMLYYDEDPELRRAIYHWHEEVANYVKDSLQAHQLLAANYVLPKHYDELDSSYYVKNIDIAEYNHFVGSGFDRYQDMHKRAERIRSSLRNVGCEKPILIGESLASFEGSKDDCDRDIGWKKNLVLSSFSGVAGSAPSWDDMHDMALWLEGNNKIFQDLVRADLNKGNWKTTLSSRKDQLADLMGQVSEDGTRAWAVLNNNTWNFYSMRTCDSCDCVKYAQPNELGQWGMDDKIKTLQDVDQAWFGNRIKLNDIKRKSSFSVIYFNALTGKEMGTEVVKSNRKGEAKLDFPTLQVTKMDAQVPMIILSVKIIN